VPGVIGGRRDIETGFINVQDQWLDESLRIYTTALAPHGGS